MGNFWAIIQRTDVPPALAVCERMRAATQQCKGVSPAGELSTAYAQVASYARRNSSSSFLAQDGAGNWCCAVGTWFHQNGLAAGAEADLLAAFLQHGAQKLAQRLSGFFVIVIGEARSQTVYVITDLIGSRHAFMRVLPNGVALASSSLTLAALAETKPEALSIEEFIRTGVIYADRSFFAAVRKLEPASIYQFSDGRQVARQTYWSLSELTPSRYDREIAVEAFCEAMVSGSRQVGKLASRLVCDLTGGYDSRALVAGLLTAGTDFETTVTGAADNPDVKVAERLTRITGKRHTRVDLSEQAVTFAAVREALSLTDGEFDCVEYGLGVLPVHCRNVQTHDLTVNGSFGEVARGYWWELLFPHIGTRKQLNLRKIAARRYVVDPNSPQLFDTAGTAQLIEHFVELMRRENAGLEGHPNTLQMDNVYLRLRMHRWQGRIASATDQLLPCLSPFMLRPVLEVMLQSAPSMRQRSLLMRAMLQRLQPQLAAVRLEYGHPAEPFGLTNFYRFAPLLMNYAGKAWNKVRKHTSGQPYSAASSAARLQLWREEAVQDLLTPEHMHLSEVLSPAGLRAFLQASRQPQFLYEQQWGRVLSCEMALRAAASHRR